MPLIQHTLSITDHPLPVRPGRYIEVASARIREFTHSPVSDAMIGFVPSDYQLVYRTLDCLVDLTRSSSGTWGITLAISLTSTMT